MKRWIMPLVVVALAVMIIALGGRAKRLSTEAADLALKYEVYRQLAVAQNIQSAAKVAELSKQLAERDEEIGRLNKTVGEKNAAIAKEKARQPEVEAQYPDMVNHPLVLYWQGQFSLAQEVIAEQQKIIDAWQVKFDLQVKITDEFRAALGRSEALSRLGEQRIAVLERENKQLRGSGRLKTALVLAAAGLATYKILE